MSMNYRIEHLQNEMPHKNKDILLYANHVFESLEQFEDHHRRLVAVQAIHGSKPVGEQEVLFYETVKYMKDQLVAALEHTINDLKNVGDKHYEKHYKDGVE